MKYRKFGRTGIEISDIAPGLWGMSGWSGSDDEQSLEALQLSADLGRNFFDTAWGYGTGKATVFSDASSSSATQNLSLAATWMNSRLFVEVVLTSAARASGTSTNFPRVM